MMTCAGSSEGLPKHFPMIKIPAIEFLASAFGSPEPFKSQDATERSCCMSRPDKKQRHKAKREAKRLAARRRDSISPVKRLAESKGDMEIWMSEDFEEMGQAE